jgi:hypothetical protein
MVHSDLDVLLTCLQPHLHPNNSLLGLGTSSSSSMRSAAAAAGRLDALAAWYARRCGRKDRLIGGENAYRKAQKKQISCPCNIYRLSAHLSDLTEIPYTFLVTVFRISLKKLSPVDVQRKYAKVNGLSRH